MMQQIKEQNGAIKVFGPGRKPAPQDSRGGNQGSTTGIKAYSHRGTGDKKLTGHSGNFDSDGNLIGDGMANKKSVWTVTTKPFKEAHFATYPRDLIVDCIKAGCPEGGIVLDPFWGAGTTGIVAKSLGRNYIGIEINSDYIDISKKRFEKLGSLI
jgi:DNA modification methylase